MHHWCLPGEGTRKPFTSHIPDVPMLDSLAGTDLSVAVLNEAASIRRKLMNRKRLASSGRASPCARAPREREGAQFQTGRLSRRVAAEACSWAQKIFHLTTGRLPAGHRLARHGPFHGVFAQLTDAPFQAAAALIYIRA